jgi:glycosyltransferase involved in cell wall biosynthesis
MHIAFLEFVTIYGGAKRSTVEIAHRLSRHAKVSIIDPYGCCEEFTQAARQAGVDYHVLCPQEARIVGGAHQNILKRAFKLGKALPDILRIRHRAKNLLQKIDATVICSTSTKGIAIAGAALRRLPLVGYLRGWYTPNMVLPYAKWVFRHRCQALIAVSHATKAALMCSGIDPRKITVIQNPIDVEDILAKSKEPFPSPMPQNQRPLRILLPAMYLKAKGLHTAVKALRHLLDADYDPVLYLAGYVPFAADKTYVPRTKRLAEELGVSERVEWLGLRGDIPQLMKAASVVILPTHAEGMPRAVLEAMALARPVAATPVGGITDLILHGVTGLSFEVEDDQALAGCIMQVGDDPDEAARMGLRAQEFMRRNFSPEDHTRKLLALFRRVSEG